MLSNTSHVSLYNDVVSCKSLFKTTCPSPQKARIWYVYLAGTTKITVHTIICLKVQSEKVIQIDIQIIFSCNKYWQFESDSLEMRSMSYRTISSVRLDCNILTAGNVEFILLCSSVFYQLCYCDHARPFVSYLSECSIL